VAIAFSIGSGAKDYDSAHLFPGGFAMAFSNGFFKTAAVAAISAGALVLSEPAFAFHGGGGGFHGGGFRGGGFGGGGFRGGGWAGRPGGWHGGGWAGRPGWNGGWRGGGWNSGWGWGAPFVAAPVFGWGGGWGPGWGWDDGYYAAPVYNQCFLRRVQVQTRYGWRWRRVRYCYQ
jgi:hypothetical protein